MDASALDMPALNLRFEGASPETILGWAWRTFGPEIAATSSFQTQSVPLLHMIARVAPEMPVFFLDTGFHFAETLAFRDRLRERFGLNVVALTPEDGHEAFRRRHGDLYRRDPDLCCFINKVEPLERAMKGMRAWISGIRRDQTLHRAATPIVSLGPEGRVKVCPLAGWTRRDVWRYLHDHELPEHPLLKKGYLSIGCAPCTQPVADGADERAGRWAGREKTECGLHLTEKRPMKTTSGGAKDGA
ncbi:phosphoadenylyl-sulfate reductase [Rhodocaloribacter sp.]